MKKVYRYPEGMKNMCDAETYDGELIERKVARLTENNEPIDDSAPMNYTERKDGVLPQYDVRTDKWDIALNAMEAVSMAELDKIAKGNTGPKETEDKPKEEPVEQPR